MRLYRALFITLLALVVLCALACRGSSEAGNDSGPSMPDDTQPPVVTMAINDLAERLGISSSEVNVVEVRPTQWPDACLGVYYADRLCLQAITPGYQVLLSANGANYTYHTDLNENVVAVDFVEGATVGVPDSRPQGRAGVPPEARLLAGQNDQVGGIGSYCWSGNSLGRCVDSVGVSVPKDVITVSDGENVTFVLGFEPENASLTVLPHSSGTIVAKVGGFDIWQGQPTAEATLTYGWVDLSQALNVTLDLEPGRYVIELFVSGQPGDVSYGFFVEIVGE